ncbi:unnamed protein product, partial [Mesorhabditis belari]|uniref:EF-hand domain-containing protein n=1 Tax=Mesorhabditis belari TaxID=2138241 RepID=A0AAF3FNU5_9BILA
MKCLFAFNIIFVLLALAEACCDHYKIGECCGNGRCNIFCCNCDGGCNQNCHTDVDSIIDNSAKILGALRGKREVYQTTNAYSQRRHTAIKRFSGMDENADGYITIEEAHQFLNETVGLLELLYEKHPSWFEQIDTNGDMKIQPYELDWHLDN